tara:strand:+ start:117 stop:812 length:696 start_codon:yes stop_codon:yes gene_type:complete
MAYGKLKVDTLTWDDSGTDTDVTISSLAAKADLNSPTFTGTAIFNNITVNGTTTTINSTTLTVDDKNIVLGSVDTPTDTTASGGGITLKGATDKTFNWIDSTDSWTSSENIEVAAGKIFKDDKGNLRSIPVNAQSSSATYTAATSDAGKAIHATSTTQTVELSGSAGFSAGDAVTIINGDSSTLNITATNSLSLRNTADAATGNRALSQYGMATVFFTSSTVAYISGAGLS